MGRGLLSIGVFVAPGAVPRGGNANSKTFACSSCSTARRAPESGTSVVHTHTHRINATSSGNLLSFAFFPMLENMYSESKVRTWSDRSACAPNISDLCNLDLVLQGPLNVPGPVCPCFTKHDRFEICRIGSNFDRLSSVGWTRANVGPMLTNLGLGFARARPHVNHPGRKLANYDQEHAKFGKTLASLGRFYVTWIATHAPDG